MNALSFLYVAVGGAVGAMARHLVQSLFLRGGFPFGTFTVNILGGFLLGAWVAAIFYYFPERSRELNLLVAVGFLGGFTTFSAFTMDVYLMMERGLLVQTVAYVVGSVFLSLAALFAGMWVVKFLTV